MRYSLESRSLDDFTVFEIKDEKKCASVVIVPELGNTCVSYRQKIGDEYIDLIDSPPSISLIKEKPSSYGIPILFLFPNRVRLIIKSDKNFREIVIFNPPERDAMAIEPYTCTTDAINLQPQRIDAGLKVLKPGEVFRGNISFNVESY